LLLLTLRDLRYRATRFLVVIVGTGVVLTLLFLMTGLVEQFNQEPYRSVQAIGADWWAVPAGVSGPFTASATLDQTLVDELVPSVAGEPVVVARGTLTVAGEPTEAIVIGHVAGGLVAPPLLEGRPVATPGEVVVDASAGAALADVVRLADTDLTVVGLSEDTSLLAGQPLVFVEIDQARGAMFGGAPVTGAVIFQGEGAPSIAGVDFLSADEVAADALGPLENAISSIDLIRGLLWGVAAIIIGAVVYLSALERQRDFAVLRAVGGTVGQLSGSLALQAVLVGLGAVMLAALLQALLVPVFPLKVRVPLRALWQLPLLSVVVSLMAAGAGLRRVRKADPALAFGGPGT
jgi:putative ABC transport system permease protein